MNTSPRCPLCAHALSQLEYDKALRKLKSKLTRYQRTLEKMRRKKQHTKVHLTRRELQIMSTVAAGYSNKDIAQHLRISEITVKHHLSNSFDKIGVSTRLELALFALSH